jgi:cell division protein FtsA
LEESILVNAFGEEGPIQIRRHDLALIIEARVEEIFGMVLQEIKRSGYDGLLPAGMVLTGGSSLLPGIREVANSVLRIPVRVAQPSGLLGMTDQILSPAYATSVGLLKWAVLMSEFTQYSKVGTGSLLEGGDNWNKVKGWLRRLLP